MNVLQCASATYFCHRFAMLSCLNLIGCKGGLGGWTDKAVVNAVLTSYKITDFYHSGRGYNFEVLMCSKLIETKCALVYLDQLSTCLCSEWWIGPDILEVVETYHDELLWLQNNQVYFVIMKLSNILNSGCWRITDKYSSKKWNNVAVKCWWLPHRIGSFKYLQLIHIVQFSYRSTPPILHVKFSLSLEVTIQCVKAIVSRLL